MKITACSLAYLSFSSPAHAQISEFKLTASDADTFDQFGTSVSISGDYAVIGAAADDDNGEISGSAYVFKRTGGTWVQESKLLSSDGSELDSFGFSVSISGNYAVVGAWRDDDNGDESGSAYVFKRADTSWIQEAKLLPSDGKEDDRFGWSVAISAEFIIVGAINIGTDAGTAYVFKRSGTNWVEESKLLASDRQPFDHFGGSVSISGNYAVVGSDGDDDNGSSSGSAYVFRRTDTSWIQEAKLLPLDGDEHDQFGISVSISGDYAVIGADFDEDNGEVSGSAYVFNRSDTSWTQDVKLLAPDGQIEDIFGRSVAISAEFIIVGARLHDAIGRDSGAAYIFMHVDDDWGQGVKLLPSDGIDHDSFGNSVSISGGYAIVGSLYDDDNGGQSGSAYVYSGITVGIDNVREGLPTQITLLPNYPNPFNPQTVIEYALPRSGDISLIIYNLRGEEVAFLINGNMPAGIHSVTWNASNFASGIYFYRLQARPTSGGQAGDFVQTRKMVLLK